MKVADAEKRNNYQLDTQIVFTLIFCDIFQASIKYVPALNNQRQSDAIRNCVWQWIYVYNANYQPYIGHFKRLLCMKCDGGDLT